METSSEIYFYSHKDEFGYMSNFFPIEFVNENGIKFNCSEQYLMYYKSKLFDSENNQILQQILNEKSPTKIKKLGRMVKNYNEQIWSQSRYQVMLNALRLKFNQNEIIKNKLIQTYPKMLYEASPSDNIWGIGFSANIAITKNKSNFGTNLLGNVLVQIRNDLLT